MTLLRSSLSLPLRSGRHVAVRGAVGALMLSWAMAANAQIGVAPPQKVEPVGVPSKQGSGPVGAKVKGATTVENEAKGAKPIKSEAKSAATVKSETKAATTAKSETKGASTVESTTKSAATIESLLRGALPIESQVKAPTLVGLVGIDGALWATLNKIAEGQLTIDAAWEQGLLSAPKVIEALEWRQRLTDDERSGDIKVALAGSLVRLAPETVAKPEQLNARVRLLLCRYYSDIGDARAVPLCEALIAEKLEGREVKMPSRAKSEPDDQSFWLRSIIALAQYYEKVEQWQTAAKTWERGLGFWQDVDWFQAGVRIDAARVYTTLGQDAKARAIYEQVPQFGQLWFTGLAIYDQSSRLIRDGRIAAGRTMLDSFFNKLQTKRLMELPSPNL